MDSENGAYLDTIGWIHYNLGNYEKARDYIFQAISFREDSAIVIEHLGDVYYKLGDIDEALEYWNQAFEKNTANSELKKKIESNEI